MVVHSRFAREYLAGFGCRTPVIVAPHPLVEGDDQIDEARMRRASLRDGIVDEDGVIVGIAGDLNASKGIEELLDAANRTQQKVRVVLVGRTSAHWDLASILRRSGVGDLVTVVNDTSDADFLAWLCAFDILVNIRNPHRGETSGSLVRALHAGVPTIVSGVGTYLEVPNDVVVRIAPGAPDPSELATAIDRLAEDPARRLDMGDRARRYAQDALAPARTAAAYREAIEEVLSRRADPTRAALARWAGGLRAIGVAPQHVARGFGVGYAEALAEFRSGG